MSLTRSLALLGFSFFLSTSVLSAEIGRTQVGGRDIILDSNGTWAYADVAATTPSTDASCSTGSLIQSKKLPVSICVAKPWRIDSTPGTAVEVQIQQPELDMFAVLITERTQMPITALREAIIQNAASAANVRPEDVAILKEGDETVGGSTWRYIEYEVTISGGKFRFGNYHTSLGDKGVIQVAFWTSAAYFDESRPTMQGQMENIKLTAQ